MKKKINWFSCSVSRKLMIRPAYYINSSQVRDTLSSCFWFIEVITTGFAMAIIQ